jgi:hypothetical protein
MAYVIQLGSKRVSSIYGSPSESTMKKHTTTLGMLAFVVGFVIFGANPLTGQAAEGETWTWGPFSKLSANRDSSPLYSSNSSSKSSWWPNWKAPKMPKMPWDKSGPRVSSYSTAGTSTWNKMKQSTAAFGKKTWEVLDPYPDPKPQTYSEPKPKKSNWFTGMFKKEEPKKIETLPDWLRQEAPKL